MSAAVWRRIAAAVLVAGIVWLAPGRESPAAPAPAAVSTEHRAVGFRDGDRLREHFEKHGAEFGLATADAYLARAQALRDRPAGGPVLEQVRTDGVITRYDRDDGAFLAYDPDLTIRTFFRPNDGEAYFRRQAAR